MTAPNAFARIIVGYDDSRAAETALRQAIALAEQYGGEIVAVNVSGVCASAALPVPTKAALPAFDVAPVLRSLDAERRGLFEKLSRFVELCEIPVRMDFATSGVAAGILDAAARWTATAIAVGTHARTGVAHFVVGSVAEEVVRGASIPVIVRHADGVRRPLKHVVVGIDASEPAASAAAFAVAIASKRNVRICYCTVIDTGSVLQPGADLAFDPTPLLSTLRADARDALDAALQEANRAGVYPDTEVAEGADVDRTLCEMGARHDADAIVVGTHKRGDFARLFIGSTAEALIRRADRPVIVVPAEPATTRSRVVEPTAPFFGLAS